MAYKDAYDKLLKSRSISIYKYIYMKNKKYEFT